MKRFLTIILIFNLFFIGCNQSSQKASTDDKILVHFIDVGQGDSTLIQVNNINLLIDSGPKSSRKKLKSFLDSQNIDKIHYAIATHPHEDHIGNMSYIIDNYSVDKFFAPKIESNSKSFELMIEALKRSSLKINTLKSGSSNLSLGEDTNVTVFSPSKNNYDNLNNYSPIMKIAYKDISFLFTGDAEKLVENEVLVNHSDKLKSNVIKIGHHGSKTSTSLDFIYAISPQIAILSYEKDNRYGHPHDETLSILKDKKITNFSTAENGNISFYSDGKKLFQAK